MDGDRFGQLPRGSHEDAVSSPHVVYDHLVSESTLNGPTEQPLLRTGITGSPCESSHARAALGTVGGLDGLLIPGETYRDNSSPIRLGRGAPDSLHW